MKHHTWAEMFNRLRLYVDNQQGSNTFVDPVNDHDLMSWVKDQRRQYRNLKENAGEAQESSSASNRPPGSALDSSRIRALEQIGFTWDMRHDVEWKRRFEELCEYKERNGTCMVPARCKEYPKLGRWVMTQRRQYVLMGREGKESRMTRERLEMLNSIEFVWVVRNKTESSERSSNSKIELLQQFKNQHGHCDVPSHYPENIKLGQWVKHLRTQYKKMQEGKNYTGLTTDLIKTLDDIGFVWETERAPTTDYRVSTTANRSNIGHSDPFANALASMRTATNRAAAAGTENQEASTTRRRGNLVGCSGNSLVATGRRSPDNEGSTASTTTDRSNIGHSDPFANALASMRAATNRAAAAAATENQEASTTRRHGNLWQQSPTIFNIPQQAQQRIGLHSQSYLTHPYALNGYADHNRMPVTAVYAPTIYMAPSGLPPSSFVASPIQSNNNNMAAQFYTPGPNFFLPPRRRFY